MFSGQDQSSSLLIFECGKQQHFASTCSYIELIPREFPLFFVQKTAFSTCLKGFYKQKLFSQVPVSIFACLINIGWPQKISGLCHNSKNFDNLQNFKKMQRNSKLKKFEIIDNEMHSPFQTFSLLNNLLSIQLKGGTTENKSYCF